MKFVTLQSNLNGMNAIQSPANGWQPFAQISLSDPFFDSLKSDYPGFEAWFARKANENAFVQYQNGQLQAFLYLKEERDAVTDVNPALPAAPRLKVGTFKIEAHNTKLGERFVKKIMDAAVVKGCGEIYVTIYPKHSGLIGLLERYGFALVGSKGEEGVWLKRLDAPHGDLLKDYPVIRPEGKRKFVLGIHPRFHTELFPDSILRNEENHASRLVRDVSHTNGIHKAYICKMRGVEDLERGDILVIYRTNDGQGAARYRSVVTSVCQVEEVRRVQDFGSFDEFAEYVKSRTIFSDEVLKNCYADRNMVVIRMIYNFALPHRLTQGTLKDQAQFSPDYWGFFPISDRQFRFILQQSQVHEGFIID